MTPGQIRAAREAHEASAAGVAATIEPGDYYADGNSVRSNETGATVFEGVSHWDAIAVMLAIPKQGSTPMTQSPDTTAHSVTIAWPAT